MDCPKILRPEQYAAVKQMKIGCILNGGVGSGKSRTALYYYFELNGGSMLGDKFKPMNNMQKLVIITTAKKRDEKEWEKELALFLLSPEENDIVIDSWQNIQKYVGTEEAFIIFDEDKVTGKGAWVKAFLKLTKLNDWIILSASPGDQWSDYIPVFIANGFYRNRTEFNAEHIIWSPYTKYPSIQKYLNEGRLIRLRNSILIDIDITRDTVPHHEDVYCSYDVVGYKEVSKTRWNVQEDKPIESPAEYCYQLRKVVNSSPDRQIKLLEIFESHPKLIVFYNFDYELDILRTLFEESGITLAEYNGHKHQPVPKGKSWVYLVQYTSGCEAWNCVSTDTIVFFSQTYSYKMMIQSCGRIDRLNTPYKDLYYYHLKSRAGIDLAISKALSEKRDFNERRYLNSVK